MLLALRISNFAVMEETEVSFGPGLTVLTGETGAGKSILVDALGLLLGGRADAEVIRSGTDEASVEGLFDQSGILEQRLGELGLPMHGEEISVRRVFARTGRGKVYVNGSLVTVGVLTQLMRGAVDIAGQHEHMGLFDPKGHAQLLDKTFDQSTLLEAFREDWLALKAVEGRIQDLGGDEKQAEARADFLRFQLQELEACAPDPKKDATLEDERRRLLGTEKLRRACDEALSLVSEDDSGTAAALERVGRTVLILGESAKVDAGLSPVVGTLSSSLADLEEACRMLSRYREALEADPERLAEVDERLDALKRLCRKHGTDVAGLVGLQGSLREELERLENRRGHLDLLLHERATATTRALDSAEALSRGRAQAAMRFSEAVREGLSELAMAKSAFEVRLSRLPELTSRGLDDVELLFTANPGDPLRPLSRVASGGEASRVMLALKRSLAQNDEGVCSVLDEADAGVGGAVAEVVGRMMKDVSAHRQVLCITHLPQVAAFADAHLRIEKSVSGGRTFSTVVPLDSPSERTQELARMLSGLKVTREALGAAEALIRSAQRASRRLKPPSPKDTPRGLQPPLRKTA